MSYLRPISMLRSAAAFRPALATAPRARALQVRFAHQGYGDGKGNPAGENPQKQGKNPSEELEHPGPPPPNVGKGKSSSQSASQSDSSSSKSTSKSQSQSNDGASKSPQPKILNENPPTQGNEDESVKEHNREMDQRAERAHESVSNEDAEKDKVPPKFWSGQGGRDKDP